jgi:serine/threonine protein kinase
VAAAADADSILFERLAQAVAPEYSLKREIARGGMGAVYLAHDVALDRPVAVKLLLPEHATAELAARFLREAQVLARLRHPSIVTVHQVCEKAGLFYYIMEWLEGETLQARIARGPFAHSDAIRAGGELLDALSVAHRHGWVHRDVKPGNIFLSDGRAILTDFGIARPLSEEATSLTETRQMIGTLAYMSPEQREGRHVTEASDIYSAGLVIYEALSGRRWWQRDQESHDWSGVPSRFRAVLRKSLEQSPSDRWKTAALFRSKLFKSQRLGSRVVLGTAAVLLAAVILYIVLRPPPPVRTTGQVVRLQPLEERGESGWGDLIGASVTASLASFPDLIVSGPFESPAEKPKSTDLVLIGVVETNGSRLRATIQSKPGYSRPIKVTKEGESANWRSLADSLADTLIYAIYRNSSSRDMSLPGGALPRTAAGWRAWSQAEPLFTQARWGEAAIAYRQAEAIDPTCLLCSFRISDIDRWLDMPHDSSRLARLQAHINDFPSHYRLLIQAAAARWPERITLMDSAVRTRDFFLASFHRGDEIFHRGPLYGRHRSEAISDLEQTVRLRPDFAPAWEHLAWVRIAESDSTGAIHALDSLALAGAVVDPTSVGLRFLLQAAFAYRFAAPGSGDDIINGALNIPEVAGFPALAMAPRLMLTFEAPGAAIGMGQIFARRTAIAEIRSGLLAQLFGHLARGQPDSALRYASRLQARSPGVEADLFAAQLAGVIALVEPDSSLGDNSRAITAMEGLRRFTLSGAAGDAARRRAAWLVILLAERTGAGDQVELAHHVLGQGSSPTARYYLALIQADQLAARGLFDRAIALTEWNGDDLVRLPDPFFSTVTHFLRAEWFDRQGNTRAALMTLLWHEANDFGTYPVGDPLPPEVDLAFGTLARWRQARMLERSGAFAPDMCRAYQAVARLWRQGNSKHRDRAALAAERFSSLHCDTE